VELESAIKLCTLGGLLAVMLAMGLRAPLEDVLRAVRRTQLLTWALVANFILVPLITVGILRWFEAAPMIAVGFLILAVCPGAPVGPPFAAIAKADVPASLGLMVILAVLSAVLSPALLTLLLGRLGTEGELRIDYLAIVRPLLVTQILPLTCGMLILRQRPKLAAAAAPLLSLVGNLLLLIVVALLIVNEQQSLAAVKWRGWLGMLLLLAASLAIGWLCGGPELATRKTLALTTASRNAAVGLAIASTNFPGTAALPAVIAYAVLSILGTLACALWFGTWNTVVEH
jgi:BASS family bile acid:Na+ symporter